MELGDEHIHGISIPRASAAERVERSRMRVVGAVLFFLTLVFRWPSEAAVAPASTAGQKESEAHGARSPHEKFQDKHYEGGEHHEDLDHQAVLGSKKAAEEFDSLSPEESKRRLRILAKKMDVDGNGFVDRKELTDWIHKSMIALDAEEEEERFDEMDEDGDGKVSWEEYKKDAFDDDEDGDPSSMDPEDLKLMEEDSRYFKAADEDKNGFLEKTEFGAFQNPENHQHMHDTLVQLTLKEKDKDGDGKLDLEEFMGDVAEKPDSEWYRIEKRRFQNEYDGDGDGFLDKAEMRRWLVPDVTQTAREEMEHLFQEADTDKDDKLSFEEILNEHQLFVGSEATNYGEHLESLKDEL